MLKQTAALSPSSFLRTEPALRSGLPASSRHPERQRRISVKIASGKNINKYQSAGRQTYSQGSARLLSGKGAGRYVPQGHTISKIKILPLSYKAAGFYCFLFPNQDYFFRAASCCFSCSFSCSSLACFCSRFLISFMISETVPSEGRDTWPPWPILLV